MKTLALTSLALTSLALTSLALSACTLAPKYVRPALPVAQDWPVADAAQGQNAGDLPWKQVFLDARLQHVIDAALLNNRDLRVAALNIETARASYLMTRSGLLPALNGNLGETRTHQAGVDSDLYSAALAVPAWELDLFGKARSQAQAAKESFLASDETRRATQISLISETAQAWFTLAADQDLLRLARETLRTRQEGYDLTQRKFDLGAAAETDLRALEILTEQARADAAQYETQVQQDKDALNLLAGTQLSEADLPRTLPDGAVLSDLPAGLPSDVLTRRPDVLAAEHAIKAADGDIGAARAAFFPSVSLTGSTGSASDSLNDLFKSGTGAWSFAPSLSLPIFRGGYNLANLKGAKASQQIAVASYEKTVQAAFRDVADALAVRAGIETRLTATGKAANAAGAALTLGQARYDKGVDSYLNLLDAQRTAYSAQQALIAVQLARAANLAGLYAALGGGVS